MNSKVYLLLFFLFAVSDVALPQDSIRPQIGLTLSGGGAKGLAHIGILQALDSAGLQVDYVSGTSMGSVIGALYAIGYSGKDIEQIARQSDWKALLSNQIDLRAVAMEEKDEYGRYALEIPLKNGRFDIPTGALESQELWLKLSEAFFPAYRYKDFDQFYRPFRAVATDVESGNPVILKDGELIAAVRASIAIPGVFTAVEKDGRILVDGGAARNLPVSEALAMGSDYLIASNVSISLREKEKLNNPLRILAQLAAIHESEDRKNQISLANLYIHHQLDNYHTGSFEKASAILDSGIIAGQRWYPVFKSLADSLYGGLPEIQPERLPVHQDSIFITQSAAEGLDKANQKAFLNGLLFEDGRWYTPVQISELIRRSYGSLAWSKIHYRLVPESADSARIVFEVKENPSTEFKLGVHFHTFSGLGLIANASTRDLFPNSRSFIKVNLGESSRLRISHLQYPGGTRKIALLTELQAEKFLASRYYHFQENGQYRLSNFLIDARFQVGSSRKFTSGVGGRFEQIGINPLLSSALEADARGKMWMPFTFLKINTLDQNYYPEKGIRFSAELAKVFPRNQEFSYFLNGAPYPVETDILRQEEPFLQGAFQAEWYQKLNGRLTFSATCQGGISFSRQENIFNAFHIGGMQALYRNQIVFPGLNDYSTYSNSVAALQLGFRQTLSGNLYLMMRSSGLVRDFFQLDSGSLNINWLSGHALSLAYNSLLGPIEFSVMFSEKVKTAAAYVNIGFTF